MVEWQAVSRPGRTGGLQFQPRGGAGPPLVPPGPVSCSAAALELLGLLGHIPADLVQTRQLPGQGTRGPQGRPHPVSSLATEPPSQTADDIIATATGCPAGDITGPQ